MSTAPAIELALQSTAQEHHHASAATHGAAPKWAMWYAKNLRPALAEGVWW